MTTLLLGGAGRSGSRIHDRLTRLGVPTATDTEPLAYLSTDILDGRNASLAHGVQDLLERQPSSLRTVARRAAAAGAWS